MAAGIKENDRGIVFGNATWHRMGQYLTTWENITFDQVRKVLGFEVEKEQVYREIQTLHDGPPDYEKVEGNFALVDKDTNKVIYPGVGNRYTVVQNETLIDYVERYIMPNAPNLKIDSAGTLFGRQKSYLSLRIEEFQVKGDKSQTVSRLMWANPQGGSSLVACTHNTRIECANTEAIAELEGASRGTVARFRHTASAAAALKDHLVDLAEIYAGLDRHKMMLDQMASTSVDTTYVRDFLDDYLPLPARTFDDKGEELANRSRSIVKNKRDKIQDIFESDQALNGASHTRYGLYMAVTNYVDHHSTIRGGDEGTRWWDGIMGNKAEEKQKALQLLAA
jgi:phage/plasmid-like protein (TIGR03299 family)